MTALFKPKGYTSVAPYIMADDAQRVVDFLRDALDGEELRRFMQADGSIAHVEVRVDDTVVMLSDGTDEHPPFPVWLHVFVPDVNEAYRRALDSGATSAQEPASSADDPDVRCGVVDPAGNTWWLTQQVGADQ